MCGIVGLALPNVKIKPNMVAQHKPVTALKVEDLDLKQMQEKNLTNRVKVSKMVLLK